MKFHNQFYQNGYFIVKGLFSKEEVAIMRSAFDRMRQVAAQLDSSTELHNSKFIIEDNKLKRVIWAGGIEPVLLEFGEDARILKLITELLGTNEFVQILNQAHFKTPGDGVKFKPHQDIHNRDKGDGTWTDIDGRGSFIQTMIAIDDIGIDNGPVYFYPQSHIKGTLTEDEIKDLEKTSAKELLIMEAGDMAFWSPYWVHGSDINSSTKSRNTLLNGYCLKGANRRVYTGCGTGINLIYNSTSQTSLSPQQIEKQHKIAEVLNIWKNEIDPKAESNWKEYQKEMISGIKINSEDFEE